MADDLVLPAQKQAMENEMVLELSKRLATHLEEKWAQFDFALRQHLSPAKRQHLTNFGEAFAALKDRVAIQIGNYENLRDMVNPIDVELGHTIDRYKNKMGASDTLHHPCKPADPVKKLEYEMANRLNRHICRTLTDKWSDFLVSLSPHLDEGCRARMKNIYMVMEELLNNKKISTGNYQILRELVTPIHSEMGKIIDEYTEKMRAQRKLDRQ